MADSQTDPQATSAAANETDETDSKEAASEAQIAPTQDIKLEKKIGPLVGIAIVVGVMMGSGIFISPTYVLANSGSVGIALLVWAVSGVVSIIGSLCYVELGTTIVVSGGDYAYIYTAFGPIPAFLYVWVTTVVGAPTMLAIMASAFANYILYPFFTGSESCSPPPSSLYLLAAVCLLLVMFLNIYSVKWVARAQGICTALVVVSLLVIVITGMIKLGQGNTANFVNGFKTLEGLHTTPGSVALAFYGSWFAYGGWSILNFLIEELRNPIKDLPIILIISLPLVTVIFLLVNIAYLAVLEPQEMLASKVVAFSFGRKALGRASWIIPVAVSVSMIGGLNGGLLKGSRTCMVGARKGQFPSVLGMIQVQRKTPTPSLLFVSSFTLIFLTSNDIGKLINCFIIVTWGTVLASLIGLLYLRWKRPELKRPFKVNLLLPVVFVLVCATVIVLGFISAPFDSLIGVGMTLTGLPVYAICIHWTNKPDWLRKMNFAVTVFIQKLLFVGQEDTT